MRQIVTAALVSILFLALGAVIAARGETPAQKAAGEIRALAEARKLCGPTWINGFVRADLAASDQLRIWRKADIASLYYFAGDVLGIVLRRPAGSAGKLFIVGNAKIATFLRCLSGRDR